MDPFGTQTITDLRFELKKSLDDETLSSKILKSWFDEDLAILQFSNYNIAAFDCNGRLINLSLNSMSRQSATLNYHLINVKVDAIRFGRESLLTLSDSTLQVLPYKRKKVK